MVIEVIELTTREVSTFEENVEVTVLDGQVFTTEFVNLGDTPSGYSGEGGKKLKVNSSEDGIEFAEDTFDSLADTPDSKVADGFVKANAAGDGLEYVNPTLSAGAGLTVGNPDIKDSPTVALNVGDGLEVDSSNNLGVDSTVVRADTTITAGDGLSGGGDLSASRTLSVNADRGLNVTSDSVGVNLDSDSGLSTSGGSLKLDIANVKEKTVTSGSDVFIFEDSTGLNRVTRDNLLASVAKSTEHRGVVHPKSSMPAPITTLTVTGDLENPTISQGVAPSTTSPNPSGFLYVIELDQADKQTGVTIRMGGAAGSPVDLLVFDSDVLQWIGDRFFHFKSGDAVISCFGRQGVVTAQANDYSASQIANTPKGDVTSTNAQGAIDQLESSISNLRNGTIKAGDADKLDGLDSSKFARRDAANTLSETNTFTGLPVINRIGEMLKLGGGTQLDNQDGWVSLGNATHGWQLKYVGTTSGTDGNEFRIESGNSNKYWQFDHDGNFEYNDGSSTYKIWHEGNDGAGSGLDADTLDGLQASQFMRSDGSATIGGDLTMGTNAIYGVSPSYAIDFNQADITLNSNGDVFINADTGDADTGKSVDIQAGQNKLKVSSGAGSKTDAIEYNGNKIWHEGNDGAGSGLDADTLQGLSPSDFLTSAGWQYGIGDRRNDGDIIPNGYRNSSISYTFTDDIAGFPTSWASALTLKGWGNDYRVWQLMSSSDANDDAQDLYFRTGRGSTWGDLRKVWDSGSSNKETAGQIKITYDDNNVSGKNAPLVISNGGGGSSSQENNALIRIANYNPAIDIEDLSGGVIGKPVRLLNLSNNLKIGLRTDSSNSFAEWYSFGVGGMTTQTPVLQSNTTGNFYVRRGDDTNHHLNFLSNDNTVLSAGDGAVYLRPKGGGSSTNEAILQNDGTFEMKSVHAGSGVVDGNLRVKGDLVVDGSGSSSGFSIGDIIPSVASESDMLARGFLKSGQTVSRTTYADLFAVLGDRAGAGDGSSTFYIPDYGILESLDGPAGLWTNISGGTGAPSWSRPQGIALDQSTKDVYVTDRDLDQIWKKDGSTGSWTNITGGYGAPIWSDLRGIALDQSTKDVYVTDGDLDQIWKKDGSTGLWTNISGGTGAPSWSNLRDIALDQGNKDVYVTDWYLEQIWKKDGSTGSWANISGGTGAPSWSSPYGIAVDQSTKDVYVTDWNLDQIWKKDGSTGSWTNIGSGSGAPSWGYPQGIALDQSTKDVYVTDWNLRQIWKKDGSTGSWTNVSGGTGAPSWLLVQGIELDQSTKDVYINDGGLDQIWRQKNLDAPAPYYIKALDV